MVDTVGAHHHQLLAPHQTDAEEDEWHGLRRAEPARLYKDEFRKLIYFSAHGAKRNGQQVE